MPGAAVMFGVEAKGVTPPVIAKDAGTHALVPDAPHAAGFVTLALAPYGRPFAAVAGAAGAVTVRAAFTVSAKVEVFDVPTGADALAASEAVMLRFDVPGAPLTEAEEQLYVVPESGQVHVPGAETTVAFAE